MEILVNKRSCPYGTAPSGDGGNRTRVRKNRTADIYEHSRLLDSPAEVQATKGSTG